MNFNMDLSTLLDVIQSRVGETLPGLIAAIGILVVGWFVALIVRAVVRRLLGALNVNEHVARERDGTSTPIDIERAVAKGAYYLVLLLAFMAVFDALDMTQVAAPIQTLLDRVFAYLPHAVAGGGLAFVAWLLATVIHRIAAGALSQTSLDEKIGVEAGVANPSRHIADVLYWLVILVFLPGILAAFQIRGLLGPVEAMVHEALAMIPNIAAAAVIGVVGWFVARIARDVVTNLLQATGVDAVGTRAGLARTASISRLGGLVVFALILLPAITAALNALQIEAVTKPATEMLSTVMAALPNVVAAGMILAVAYYVSRFVAEIASELLAGAGFDNVPNMLGVDQAFSGEMRLSSLIGKAIVFFSMLFATVEASSRLGFSQVSGLVTMFTQFAGQILLGTAIIAIGFWISNLAHDAISRLYGKQSAAVAGVIRFSILGLVLAMGLRSMGLADDIVNLAFGLTLGAVAVAFALAFGLGGREAAGKQAEYWLKKLRSE